VAALESAGFDVIPYSHSSYDPTYEFFRSRPARLRLINDRPADSINPLMSFWRTLRNLWRDEPELVLSCGYERPETLGAIIYAHVKRLPDDRRPLIFLMQDNQQNDKRRRRAIELVKRWYLRAVDGFCVGGTTHVAYLAALRVDPYKICTGYCCVDNDHFSNAAEQMRTVGDDLAATNYFLIVSRLVPKKNLTLVLDAYALYLRRLPPNRKPWEVMIVGGGPEYEPLKNVIDNARLQSKVRMVGVLDDHELIRHYAFCRVFILASNVSEQWGVAVNEAMAAGAPVVVSRQSGCASHLVHEGQNGFTFDGNSPSELAQHMFWMHTNEDQLSGMGQKSKTIVADYSPSRFAENVIGLYRSMRLTKGGKNASQSFAAGSESIEK
jgi:glycosyltransferase involved in cell wall biosynthesis